VKPPNEAKVTAFAMFERGETIDQVVEEAGRALSTACGYLVQYINTHPSVRLDPWVNGETYDKVAEAVKDLGAVYLKPIYERLEQKIPYEQIRLVVTRIEAANTF
jgi:uncharacterized protein YpbB